MIFLRNLVLMHSIEPGKDNKPGEKGGLVSLDMKLEVPTRTRQQVDLGILNHGAIKETGKSMNQAFKWVLKAFQRPSSHPRTWISNQI